MPFALVSILSFIVVLGVMVLVHEAGHFLTAKACGVRIEVFSIGMGKRLFGFRRGDTDYRISLLPLGGYVKMAGEYGGDSGLADKGTGDPAEFTSRPRWQRILIGVSGPVTNFLLALALMTGLYMMHNEVDTYLNGPAVIDFVPADSPAARAGLRTGDRIVQFDNERNPDWQKISIRMGIDGTNTVPLTVARDGQELPLMLPLAGALGKDGPDPNTLGLTPRIQAGALTIRDVEPGYPLAKAGIKPGDTLVSLNGLSLHSTASAAAYLKQNGGAPVQLQVRRGSQILPFTVTPVEGDDGSGRKGWRLGFRSQPPPFTVVQEPFFTALAHSWHYNVTSSTQIVEVMRRLFSGHSNVKQLSGPVGIARVTGEAAMMPGWQPLINLSAQISLNLGIFNLLPFPLLDGGMILILLVESLMRHDLNPTIKERIYQVAFVVLVLFAVFVTFNDVSRIAGFGRG